jgi:hypothetical protein
MKSLSRQAPSAVAHNLNHAPCQKQFSREANGKQSNRFTPDSCCGNNRQGAKRPLNSSWPSARAQLYPALSNNMTDSLACNNCNNQTGPDPRKHIHAASADKIKCFSSRLRPYQSALASAAAKDNRQRRLACTWLANDSSCRPHRRSMGPLSAATPKEPELYSGCTARACLTACSNSSKPVPWP